MNIKVLLLSEKIKTHSQERTLLKNLGTWLGTDCLPSTTPLLACLNYSVCLSLNYCPPLKLLKLTHEL